MRLYLTLNTNTSHEIEISKKVIGKETHMSRLNILYRDDLQIRYQLCLDYLSNLHHKSLKKRAINDIHELIKDENLPDLRLLVIGFDFRSDFNKSRIKVWFEFDNSPNLLYRAIAKSGLEKEMIDLVMNENILLGFDILPDGATNMKIHLSYGNISKNHLALLKFAKLFDRPILHSFEICNRLYIAFRGGNNQKFIYFFSDDIEEIVHRLKVKKIPRDILILQGRKPYIFAAYYDEIVAQSLSEYNLYYMMDNQDFENFQIPK